jgi:quinol monooxygenase YgiN
MIAIVAKLKIKSGMEEKATYASLRMADKVQKLENECLYYEPYMPAEGTGEIYILEKYTGMEALERHRKTDHYKEFGEALKDALEGPPEIKLLKALG